MTAPAEHTAIVEPRGYVAVYRRQRDNACPACGGSNWMIGRTVAECGFCATALPLAEPLAPETPLTAETEGTER